MFAKYESTNADTLVAFAVIMIVVCAIISIRAHNKEKGTRAIYLPLIISSFSSLIYLCAVNNQPEVLRKIKGVNFTGPWFGCFAGFLFYGMIIAIFITVAVSKSNSDKAKKLQYSDSDLMLLRNFDQYDLCGYYILKGRLHNILTYKVVTIDENAAPIPFVSINYQKNADEINEYCQRNPQVGKIVNHITALEIKAKTENPDFDPLIKLEDVICAVKNDPTMHSPGGIFVSALIKNVKNKSKSILLFICTIMYYIGLTKLFMGIYNEKEVDNLIVALFFSIIICFLFLGCTYALIESLCGRLVIKPLIKHKSSDFKNLESLITYSDITLDNITDEESLKILRAYVLYMTPKNNRIISNVSLQCPGAILASVVAVRIAQRAESSDSGCSGCSGCSSCGGCSGCGGCGGCGD